MSDLRTKSQRWADIVTEFSGSWPFIIWFGVFCTIWVFINVTHIAFDPYPFLFLNWILTMVSTFQTPLIMLSQNRQNENDRANMAEVLRRLDYITELVEKKVKE